MLSPPPLTSFFSRIIDFCFHRPTVEARTALYASSKRKAEEIRVQVRNKHSASLKRGKYQKHSIELEEVCTFFLYLYHLQRVR